MNFFELTAYAEAATQTTPTQPGGAAQMISAFLPMVLVIVLLYFMMIRPQKKREKELRAMIDAMEVTEKWKDRYQVGDKVVTIGGICGKVVKIKDEFVFIESGNIGTADEKSVIKMERDAIKTVEQKIKN